ncbi:MAG: helix-turn-helix transcriptional regulator [Oscillospiraceae bacterium]|nr:helix-turn-helix transcriptional regulator [Oscillospiraceae bacterium]
MRYTERIRALREDCDKTQSEIAAMLNIGQKTYSDYELGKTRIPVDGLIVLAKFYNVSMDYICGVSDVKKPFSKNK